MTNTTPLGTENLHLYPVYKQKEQSTQKEFMLFNRNKFEPRRALKIKYFLNTTPVKP